MIIQRRLVYLVATLSLCLLPFWMRWMTTPYPFPPLYASRYFIIIPMLITTAIWLARGRAAVRPLAQSPISAIWAFSLMLLVLWAFASRGWAFIGGLHPEIADSAALQWGIAALFALALAGLRFPIPLAIGAFSVGLCINTAITILQASHQGAIGLPFLGEFAMSPTTQGASILRAGDLEYLRPYGFMPHPNLLAGLLVTGLLAAIPLLTSFRPIIRLLAALLLPLGLAALLLTFSRAAWGGFALGVIILMPLIWRRLLHDRSLRLPFLLSTLLAVVMGIGFFVQHQPFILARTGQVAESIEMRSVADRLVYTDFALRSIGERPLLGVGIGNFPWRTSYYLVDTFYDLRGDNVHNIYLSVLAELGTPGLILYGTGLLSGFIGGVLVLRRTHPQHRLSRAAFIAIAAALCAIGWLDHYPYTLIYFQVALWGTLAISLTGENQKGASTIDAPRI